MTDWLEKYGAVDPVGAAVFAEFNAGSDEKLITMVSHTGKDPSKGQLQAGVWVFLGGRMDRPEVREVDSRVFAFGGNVALTEFAPVYSTYIGELQSDRHLPTSQTEREELMHIDKDILLATDQQLRSTRSKLLGGFLQEEYLWRYA